VKVKHIEWSIGVVQHSVVDGVRVLDRHPIGFQRSIEEGEIWVAIVVWIAHHVRHVFSHGEPAPVCKAVRFRGAIIMPSLRSPGNGRSVLGFTTG
jgi:hypothetical protein